MTKRMTAQAFLYLKNEFPVEFEALGVLEIPISRFDLFRVKKKKNKTNVDRYGEKLSAIFAWLDENCDQPYYAKFGDYSRHSSEATVVFYFMEPTDAMAFKLMFQ